ncbi:MAG: glycosyltransferase family 2 protein [Bacteroidales bacterium]|nr:glycosyltransferase family 2 protein [Bacteroidales bacterium]
MKTAVVILNWNTLELLERFIPGILESISGMDACLVVADSGSTDGSCEMLCKKFPEVRVISLGENFGFTGGYNRALAQIDDAELFVLLNSDVDVPSGWLQPLVGWMETHRDCAVCGPKLLALDGNASDGFVRTDRFEYAGAAGGYVDRFGYPFCRGRVLGRVDTDRGQYDTPVSVHWASGACMMVRAEAWKALGGLDESFFAHMEEIDFCWRARLQGWSVWNVPQSKVYHLGGATLSPSSPLKLKLNFRNSLVTLSKNLPATVGGLRARIRIFFRMVLDGGSWLVYMLSGRKEYAGAVLEAHREFRKFKIIRTTGSKSIKISEICILPLALFCGAGVFKYLERYEDCH